MQTYYQLNLEERRAYQRDYYHKNRLLSIEKSKAYYYKRKAKGYVRRGKDYVNNPPAPPPKDTPVKEKRRPGRPRIHPVGSRVPRKSEKRENILYPEPAKMSYKFPEASYILSFD